MVQSLHHRLIGLGDAVQLRILQLSRHCLGGQSLLAGSPHHLADRIVYTVRHQQCEKQYDDRHKQTNSQKEEANPGHRSGELSVGNQPYQRKFVINLRSYGQESPLRRAHNLGGSLGQISVFPQNILQTFPDPVYLPRSLLINDIPVPVNQQELFLLRLRQG